MIRKEKILSPVEEADPRWSPGDYVYLLAPPEKAEALDRFFSDMARDSRRPIRTCSATSWSKSGARSPWGALVRHLRHGGRTT